MTVDLEIMCTWKVHTRCARVQLVDKLCETKKKSHCLTFSEARWRVCVQSYKETMCLIYKPDDEILLRDCRWMNFICVVNFMLAWSPNKFRGKGDPS